MCLASSTLFHRAAKCKTLLPSGSVHDRYRFVSWLTRSSCSKKSKYCWSVEDPSCICIIFWSINRDVGSRMEFLGLVRGESELLVVDFSNVRASFCRFGSIRFRVASTYLSDRFRLSFSVAASEREVSIRFQVRVLDEEGKCDDKLALANPSAKSSTDSWRARFRLAN